MNIIELYKALHVAPVVTVRGLMTRELLNVHYSVAPGDEFLNHALRKFKREYFNAEMKWYRRGDRYDLSITEHASAWKDCVASDGGINSNYGQYLYSGKGGSLQWCIDELKHDPNSRRAVVSILGQHPLHWEGTDQPCTISAQFLVRKRLLTCIVTMRSQDLVWGAGNDIPAFTAFAREVVGALGIHMGMLHFNVGSMHVYERHFKLLEAISNERKGWIVQ